MQRDYFLDQTESHLDQTGSHLSRTSPFFDQTTKHFDQITRPFNQTNRPFDQAEGLRRLLAQTSARVVTVAAACAGSGVTSVVINLATALAATGKRVLILDENISPNNVGNRLALKPRYDLLNMVRGEKSWREIMLLPQPGVRVLPVARAIQALPLLSALERATLLNCLRDAAHGIDVVLVDAASVMGRHPSVSLMPTQPLLLVLNTTAHAITESYSMIKQMSVQDGRRGFLTVVNQACVAQQAHAVFSNMARVAQRHLQVQADYLGHIPTDEKLARAAQLCSAVNEVYPAAQSAQAFAGIARKLMNYLASTTEESSSLPDVVQQLMQQTRSLNRVTVN